MRSQAGIQRFNAENMGMGCKPTRGHVAEARSERIVSPEVKSFCALGTQKKGGGYVRKTN